MGTRRRPERSEGEMPDEKPALRSLSRKEFLEIYWAHVDLEEPMHATSESLALVEGYTEEEIEAEFDLRMERGSAGRNTSDVLLLKDYLEAWRIADIEPPGLTDAEHLDRRKKRDDLEGQVLARMYASQQ